MKYIKENKKIIIIALFFILLVSYFLIRNRSEEEDYFIVLRGDIENEIFETGSLKKGESLTLAFRRGGMIERINFQEGEEVRKGDIIASIDSGDLKIQLDRANEALQTAEITLQRLEKGFTEEEINNYRLSLQRAENAFYDASVLLESRKRALNSQIKDSYSRSDDAIRNRIDKFFKDSGRVFEVSIIDGNNINLFPVLPETKRRINDKKAIAEEELDNLKRLSEKEDGFLYVKEAKESLEKIELFLNEISLAINSFQTENLSYQAILSQYKADVSTARNSISLAISGLISAESGYITSRSSYNLAEDNLRLAENNLNIALLGSREEDIKIQESLVLQQRAEIRAIKREIDNSLIIAPNKGIITDILRKEGEVIQQGERIISFISEDSYYLEVDIYEGEISRVNLGDTVEIELVAFPYEKFEGKVVSMNPSGKIIDGVVYYRIIIDIYDLKEEAMPGMTTDIVIRNIEKEDVLIIPENAIKRRDGKVFVDVLKEGTIEEREIVLGARGVGRRLEVISGLEEGEKIIIK